jgi:hypothetical protein
MHFLSPPFVLHTSLPHKRFLITLLLYRLFHNRMSVAQGCVYALLFFSHEDLCSMNLTSYYSKTSLNNPNYLLDNVLNACVCRITVTTCVTSHTSKHRPIISIKINRNALRNLVLLKLWFRNLIY